MAERDSPIRSDPSPALNSSIRAGVRRVTARTPGRRNAKTGVAERVYSALRREIVTGIFPPGDPLSEHFLAKRYKASRTPIREAAVRLHQENLLRIIPKRGYFVSHMTISGLNEMYDYRAVIEGASAEIVARKDCGPEALEELTQLAKVDFDPSDRASYERFIEADTAFHLLIARLTQNKLFLRAVADVRCQMERIMYAAIDIDYYGESPAREHAAIVQAIRDRDPVAARQRMCEHIYVSKDKVQKMVGGSPRAL